MAIDMKQFHQTFFEESFEGLDVMEASLLDLDIGEADSDVINTIFRSAHSIKGGSSTFGFTDVAKFTHVLETLLDEVRDGKRQVTQEIVDLLLQSVDCMRDMLRTVRDGTESDMDHIESIRKQLEDILNSGQPESMASNDDDGETASSVNGWNIKFRPYEDMLRTGNDPVRMITVLASLGTAKIKGDIAQLPDLSSLNPEISYLGWEIELIGDIPKEKVEEVFEWVDDECDLEINVMENRRIGDRRQDDRRKGDRRGASSSGDSSSIRVDIDKVDDIINLVGELVITQSMLGQLGAEIEAEEESGKVVTDNHRTDKLRDGLTQLERNTRELQESVMRIRMLPISFVFNRFPRMVHDMASKLDKKFELVLSGEQTELDKTVLEKIGDPLVHLVRNSLDHGIESPEKRIELGKPETGTVNLNAYHKGSNIIIEITDDGAGLNREKILEKAVERGLVNEGDHITDEKVYELIMQPGFSTADVVSDVSGRGVGMDVVKKNIKALGGNIEVTSEQGKGSTFTIRLPLTLAILDGQLVRVGEETYIVPLISIIESLQIRSEQTNAIAGKAEVYKLRDDYIPIVRLYNIFGIQPDNTELNNGLMVVVEGDGVKAGLIVDDLLAQQQVVIKSLETNYSRIDGVSGATILGDGTVALILDISGLISLSHTMDPGGPKPGIAHSDEDTIETEAA